MEGGLKARASSREMSPFSVERSDNFAGAAAGEFDTVLGVKGVAEPAIYSEGLRHIASIT